MKKTPNPQGKGLVPVLAALNDARYQIRVPPKHIAQISSELFTSLFVLESRFSFKPVVGQSYYLYRKANAYQLSLLAPPQWSPLVYGQFIGRCDLQEDLTWTLDLAEAASADDQLMAAIRDRRAAFESALQQAEQVEDLLPVFQEQLPFYQRVFAAALAGSLDSSMRQSGIKGLNYAQAMGLLAVKK